MKTAILVDGGFYRRRAQAKLGEKSAQDRADELYNYCRRHLKEKNRTHELYRIFYYDCPPMTKKLYQRKKKSCFKNGKIGRNTSSLYFTA